MYCTGNANDKELPSDIIKQFVFRNSIRLMTFIISDTELFPTIFKQQKKVQPVQIKILL